MLRKLLVVAGLGFFAAASAEAITIHIDYTYDASAFFHDTGNSSDASSQAHATVEKAAQDLGAALTSATNASLNELTRTHFEGTSGPQTATLDWDIFFKDPSKTSSDPNNIVTLTTFDFAPDTFTVYAGSSVLASSTELGEGAPVNVENDPNFTTDMATESDFATALQNAANLSNSFMSRGSAVSYYQPVTDVAVNSTPLNYQLNVGPIGGFLSVTSGAKWHLDYRTLPASDESDFYTVVLHEMIHALGFGQAASWKSQVSGADWSGQNVKTLLNSDGKGVIHDFYPALPGGTPTPDGGHIADGIKSKTFADNTEQLPVMDSTLDPGIRKYITLLDIAFLKDIGYGPATPLPTPTPTPVPTPTPEATPAPTPVPTPPLPPIVSGKPKQSTTKSKFTIKGQAFGSGVTVEYKVGTGGKFIKASGGASWKFSVKLKPGANTIYVATLDPVTGQISTLKKIVVIKK